MKHLNILIFLFLGGLFFIFSSQIKFSTNFLELFFSQKSVTLFNVISKLQLSNNIYIAKKGFDEKSLDELYSLAKELKKLPQISKVTISLAPSKKLQNYYKKHYYLLADFNNTKLSKDTVFKKLSSEYEKLANSFIYIPLDTNDPLELFKIKLFPHANYLKIKDYGYVLKASTNIDTSSTKEAKILYNEVKSLLQNKQEIISYAPFFFLVENSSFIQNDVQKIVGFGTILLLFLYFVMLKNHKLLIHGFIAISSSVLGAILACAFFIGSINIMVLAFGVSITTVSIDYMFHYYFHGDFTTKKFIKQKSVFFGFITTFGVFAIFSFIDIKLFYQLSFFSATSLFIAYLLFSWVFSYLDIPKPTLKTKNKESKTFNPLIVVSLSLGLLLYSYTHLSFDENLKNLDYKNEKLLKLSKIFNENLAQNNYQNIILHAKTKELLLQKYENLQSLYPDILGIGKFILSQQKCKQKLQTLQNYDFKKVKRLVDEEGKKVGFKNAFTNSYKGINKQKCNMQEMDEMGFKIVKVDNNYYTLILIDKKYKVKLEKGMTFLDIKKILSDDMKHTKKSILKFMFLSLIFVMLMLFAVSGLDILYPLSFILFPLSVVLFFISLFGTINIMHLFALIILMAISIDYGVYMHNTNTLVETRTAIKYALFSTLAGFGVLIFSDIKALHSIGFVITIGVCAIFILIYGKRYENI